MSGLTFILEDGECAARCWRHIAANWKAKVKAGKPLVVTVEPYTTKRTLVQNRELHAVLSDIAESVMLDGRRFEMEVWKEYYKRKYLGYYRPRMPDGSRPRQLKHSSDLNVEQCREFIARIRAHATTEFGWSPQR